MFKNNFAINTRISELGSSCSRLFLLVETKKVISCNSRSTSRSKPFRCVGLDLITFDEIMCRIALELTYRIQLHQKKKKKTDIE